MVIPVNPSKNLRRPENRDDDVVIAEHPGLVAPEEGKAATPSGRAAALNRHTQGQSR